MKLTQSIPSLLLFGLCGGALQAQGSLLEQDPDGSGYTFSGLGSFSQVLAEDFQVGAAGYLLEEVVTWGVYANSNVPPAADMLTINIYQDAAGLPGLVPLHSWTTSNATRTNTGVQTTTFQVLDIYEYEFDLPTPVQLAQGDYWVEVYNTQTTAGDIWAIVDGIADPNNGHPSFAFSPALPANIWYLSQSLGNIAMKIEGSGGGSGAQINVVGTCGQVGSGVAGTNMTPNGLVGLAWSVTQGPFVIGGAACVGTTIGLVNPRAIAAVTADANGNMLVAPGSGIPQSGCGVVFVQALDFSSCTTSNVLSI